MRQSGGAHARRGRCTARVTCPPALNAVSASGVAVGEGIHADVDFVESTWDEERPASAHIGDGIKPDENFVGDDWDEERLRGLVTRDGMLGTALF